MGGEILVVDIEKRGRPESKIATDLDGRGINIPRGFIKPWMLEAYGVSVGLYGRGRYGRCKYGVRYGIFGADTYGHCKYS